MIRVLLLGCGNVGAAFVRLVRAERERVHARWQADLELSGIVRASERTDNIPNGVPVYRDALDAIAKTSPDIVVELVGGVSPADTYIEAALAAGAHVVTANKAVLAARGEQLYAAARRHRRLLLAEASVGGAIPVMRVLHTNLAFDRVERIMGVWNGTCNYILTEMEATGATFDDCLKQAVELGYAEADPTLDINGGDTAHKAAVLAQVAFGLGVDPEQIGYRGIEAFLPEDFAVARQLGLRAKLLGQLVRSGDGLSVYAGPAFLPQTHPLAQLSGPLNGIFVDGAYTGGIFLSGPGAGPEPTASTVLGDVVAAARYGYVDKDESIGWRAWPEPDPDVEAAVPFDETLSKVYLRFLTPDRPGVLGKITTMLGAADISIESVVQPQRHGTAAVPIHMTTHPALIGRVREAVAEIGEQQALSEPPLWVPIFEVDSHA